MNLGRGNIQFSPQHKLNGFSYYCDSTPTFSTSDSDFHHLYVPYSCNNQTLAVSVNQDTLNLPSTEHFLYHNLSSDSDSKESACNAGDQG